MDTYEAIVTKRDTRQFRPDPVDEADLRRILQAARMAGSAKNEQVTRLLVVVEEGERARLAECGRFARWLPSAPVVVVFVVPAEGGRPFDHGRMAQNMMLLANSLGLASCPMTFHDGDCARRVLGLPDDRSAPMGVAFGRPGPPDPNRRSSPRIPVDELVRWGRWSD
ncbi:MAG TPA: nitroreductase family protein [Acidimicrobiales bacterium]|nr:nitroreductase family protein [Acidimicrobiales bacterium]